MFASQEALTQNSNGSTETEILPCADCCTVKVTSLVALMPPTAAEIPPLHFTVSLSLLVEVVTIF
jgi:hypothetical protein